MTSQWFTPEIVQRFAGSLLHFLWQGAAIALLTAISLALMKRRSAKSRYLASTAALAAMLAAPIFTFFFYAQTGAATLRLLEWIGAYASRSANSAVDTAPWTEWIIAGWLLGVSVLNVRLIAGCRLSRALIRGGNARVPELVTMTFIRIKRRLLVTKPVRLLIHKTIDTPMVVGWFRPVVLLPVSAMTGLSEDQLLAVLAHELAHIRRCDYLVNVLQRCVESVLFYHPAVWWLSARIRTERENSCDDLAVEICGDRRLYVEALVELERRRLSVPVLAVAASGGSLFRRAQRILGETASTDWQSAIMTLVFVCIWTIAGIWQSNSLTAEPLIPPPPPPAAPALANTLTAIAAIVTAQPVAAAEALIPQPQQAAPAAERGVIEGVVVRAGAAAPVAGVEITLEGGPADPKAVQDLIRGVARRGVVYNPKQVGSVEEVLQDVIDQAGTQGVGPGFPIFDEALTAFKSVNAARFIAISNADGRFAIKDVPPGQYTIRAEREGFFDPASAPKISVTKDQTANVAISMSPGAVVGGRIRDAAGQFQHNVDVQLLSLTYQNGYPVLRTVLTKQTDDQGAYRLFWLSPGEYYILVGPGAPCPACANPAASFLRTFYPNTPDAAAAIPVTIKGGEQLSGYDIVIRNDRLARLSGKVISAIPPEETATQARVLNPNLGRPTLMLVSRDPNTPDITGGGARAVGAVDLTSGTGQFETSGILPGSYDLYARVPESNANGGAGFAWGFIPVEIGREDIAGLTINVRRTVSVNGIVTVDGRAPQQASNIRLSIQPSGSSTKLGVYQSVGQRAVTVQADGSFSVVAVPPGMFRVELGSGLPANLYLEDVRQGGISVFDSNFEVGVETPPTLEVVLRTGAAAVQGTIEDSAGKPVAGATVTLAPSRRQNRALYHTATSDANGRFVLRSVAPGDYKLFAWRQPIPAGAYFNAGFLGKYEDSGKAVSVTQTATATEKITVSSNDLAAR